MISLGEIEKLCFFCKTKQWMYHSFAIRQKRDNGILVYGQVVVRIQFSNFVEGSSTKSPTCYFSSLAKKKSEETYSPSDRTFSCIDMRPTSICLRSLLLSLTSLTT